MATFLYDVQKYAREKRKEKMKAKAKGNFV